MRKAFSFAVIGMSFAAPALARAQPPGAPEMPVGRELAAPSNALELSLATGYTQGFGNLKSGTGLPSVVTPGAAFDVGIGYRIDASWAVLWSGEYAELTAERTSSARAFTSGLAAQYHLGPMQRVDPWVEIGAGYRFLVEDASAAPILLTHGFQLARLRAGIDFRSADMLSVGPMIGADATLFYFQDSTNVRTTIDDPRISTFVFAGLQGRFDVGGRTTSPERL